MMTCQEYVFKLTSGQLEEASLPERLRATSHRLICPYCRAFTKNDARLDGILQDYKDRVLHTPPDESSS